MATDTKGGVLARPAEFLEDLVRTARKGEAGHEYVAQLSELLGNLEALYKKAHKEENIGLFFREFPNFGELRASLNYLLATNPNSKVNVGGYIKKGDLGKASMFLEKYMLMASNEPSELSELFQQSTLYLQQVREFMTEKGYEKLKGRLEKAEGKELDNAIIIAERYMRGVLALTGGEGFEGLENDLDAIVNARMTGDIEQEVTSLVKEREYIEALKTAAKYMKAAEFAYGDLPGKEEIHAKLGEIIGYEEKINSAIENARQNNAVLGERARKAMQNGSNRNRFARRAEEAKENANNALEEFEAVKAEFGRKIIEFKHMIDKYENDANYRAKLSLLVEKVKSKFGYAEYSRCLKASEEEVSEFLEARGFGKRAEKTIDTVKKTWAYFTGTLNPEELGMGIINYGYLAALENREEYKGIIKERIRNMRLAAAGVEPENHELRQKAKRVIELAVHPDKQAPHMYLDIRTMQKIYQLLEMAPDVKRQREMAYAAAEPSLDLFERIAGKAYAECHRHYITDDAARQRKMEEALPAAFFENIGFLSDGKNPGGNPKRSYEMFFPYAAAFFPIERTGFEKAPDFAELLRVDAESIAMRRLASEPQKHGLVAWFYSLFKGDN